MIIYTPSWFLQQQPEVIANMAQKAQIELAVLAIGTIQGGLGELYPPQIQPNL